MIVSGITFHGQKITVCNRLIELFRQEHNSRPDNILAESLRLELDAIMPVEYHRKRLIWLSAKWQEVLTGNHVLGFPGVPEAQRVEATNRMNELLVVLKRVYKFQREKDDITTRRLFKERHAAEIASRADTHHGNPKIADFLNNGLPSGNVSTNLAYIERLKECNSDLTEEQSEEINTARTDMKTASKADSYWDNRLDLDAFRLEFGMPEPPDPPEIYTEFSDILNPSSVYTISANNIDVNALPRNIDAWVADDKGVDHFNGDFEHLVDINVSSSIHNALFSPWTLANALNDINGLISDAGEDFLTVFVIGISGTSIAIRLGETIGTSFLTDSYSGAFNTDYFQRIKRDETVGSFGLLNDFIYSNVDMSSLLDTLALTLRAKLDLRHVFGMNSANNATTPSITGSASNLDLQEVAPLFNGFPFFFDGGHY